ncbi:hypothetical protein LINPERPRIM_LOCUS1078 [Linum perenne]
MCWIHSLGPYLLELFTLTTERLTMAANSNLLKLSTSLVSTLVVMTSGWSQIFLLLLGPTSDKRWCVTRARGHRLGYIVSCSYCSGNWVAKQFTHPVGARISTPVTLLSSTTWGCLFLPSILTANERAVLVVDDDDIRQSKQLGFLCQDPG